jgi:hypothetical protein
MSDDIEREVALLQSDDRVRIAKLLPAQRCPIDEEQSYTI